MAEITKPYEIDTSVHEKNTIDESFFKDGEETIREAMWKYKGRKMKTEFGEKVLFKIKGGGWIENERNLSQSGKCWIEEGAIVCGLARVSDNAFIGKGCQVGDTAVVSGDAVVEGKSVVGGHTYIQGHISSSKMMGSARVMDGAEVLDGSDVEYRATVFGTVEKAMVGGHTTVYGEVKDGAVVCGRSSVGEVASVIGPYVVFGCRVSGRVGKPVEEESESDG